MKKKNYKNTANDNKYNSNVHFIVDTDLFPLAEKAEEGCLDSQFDLYWAFRSGKGAKKDFEAAKYYLELSLKSLRNDYEPHIYGKLGVLWNLSLLEKEKGNYDEMKKGFHTVINFMQENIPMEEWDFELLAIMEKLTQDQQG